jgi:anti-sigma regulatory factor (Ser/Thr protein kinase)
MGLKRLADFAEGLTGDDPQAWCDAIMTDMTGGDVVADDVVVACLQLTGASWPADGPAVLRRTLTRPSQLAATRDALRAWAARQCLSPARTDDLLTACGEILANALEHGSSGPVDLRVLRADRWQIRVDVTDRGGWRPRQSDATRERGLAVVSRVAERISLDLGRNGTRLTVVLSLR